MKYKCALCKRQVYFKKLGVWISRHYAKCHKGENFKLIRVDGEFKGGL